MEYSNWDPGEPNDAFGSGQDHLYLIDNRSTWDDGYFSTKAPFVCEWGENISNPGIGKISEYALFSANNTQNFTLNGWKAYFTGNIYTGSNFVSNLCFL